MHRAGVVADERVGQGEQGDQLPDVGLAGGDQRAAEARGRHLLAAFPLAGSANEHAFAAVGLGERVDQFREVSRRPFLGRAESSAGRERDQRRLRPLPACGEPLLDRLSLCLADIDGVVVGIDGDAQRGFEQPQAVMDLMTLEQVFSPRHRSGQQSGATVATVTDAAGNSRQRRPQRGVEAVGEEDRSIEAALAQSSQQCQPIAHPGEPGPQPVRNHLVDPVSSGEEACKLALDQNGQEGLGIGAADRP